MRYVMFLVAVASLLSLTVAGVPEPKAAGKVAIAAYCPGWNSYCPEGGAVATRCANSDGETSAADLAISAFRLEEWEGSWGNNQGDYNGDWSEAGWYFCHILNMGVFCSEMATTWYFYVNGAQYGDCDSPCSGATDANDYIPDAGDVLTFGWETDGAPEVPSFDEICAARGGGGTPLKSIDTNINLGGLNGTQGNGTLPGEGSGLPRYCVNKTINLTLLAGGQPIWKPTYSSELDDLVYGFLLRVIHRNMFFWEFVQYLQTDEAGTALFTPTVAGQYEIWVSKQGYRPQNLELTVENC